MTLAFFFFPFHFGWGLFGLFFIPYFLPTIVALIRRSNSTGGIFALNFFLGWTFIGWIISIVWALTSRTQPSTVIINNTYPVSGPQTYNPPPNYNPPPYTTEPSQPAQQTSPTLRRNSPNQGQANG
ncbi:superinfection immunity protein [Puia dinghuensis]|uniref:Superinfection immunity protein n=1 Tax=Puia dinghuensis TaxID=1792502 RepID=A0A8J2XVS8_9BACT|nr:superinfection immunity protein [Puia dinghuensis]GGB18033.1 hypothetical protein GCM10011511_47280 [Puia dinghuensis]